MRSGEGGGGEWGEIEWEWEEGGGGKRGREERQSKKSLKRNRLFPACSLNPPFPRFSLQPALSCRCPLPLLCLVRGLWLLLADGVLRLLPLPLLHLPLLIQCLFPCHKLPPILSPQHCLKLPPLPFPLRLHCLLSRGSLCWRGYGLPTTLMKR